jgi:DNA primase
MTRLGIAFKRRSNELWYQCRVYNHKVKSWTSTKIISNPFNQYHGIWKCFSCGESGNIISLVQISEDVSFLEALSIVEKYQLDIEEPVVKPFYKSIVTLPKFFQAPEKKEDWNKEYLDYMFRRGITWEQIVKHRIGYVDAGYFGNRIIAPVFLDGVMKTFIARSIIPNIDNKRKVTSAIGGEPGLFGSEFSHPAKGPAIICEGWCDALHIERIGYSNAMSIQTSKVTNEQYLFLSSFPYTIVVPDGDQAGRKFVDKLSPWIDEHKFLVAILPEGEDPDSVSDEVLEDAIGNAKEWQPSKDSFSIEVVG